MNKFTTLSAVLFLTTMAKAQDLNTAIKAIDAEKYENAKSLLKNIIKSNSNNGKAAFLLGNVYLKQDYADSAKVAFNNGLAASDDGKLNNIGLGQLDLDRGDAAAAQSRFEEVTKSVKKKDITPYVYVAYAYMNSEKPNYNAAIAQLKKAKELIGNTVNADIDLALGDVYYKSKNQNESYSAYRDALLADSGSIRAKMQQGVLLKGAKSYDEAVKLFNEVTASNANYGPVYRELAETYYNWAMNKPSTHDENMKKALSYYEKYMQMTDYSLASRMRHADFLILAKDYKALEAEANEMKKLDNVNPRILRYLGYSAYENGNYDGAIKALTDFIGKGVKVIQADHYYLGLAKIAKATAVADKTDQALFQSGYNDLKGAVTAEYTLANSLNELGKKFFSAKNYSAAASIFELGISNPEIKYFDENNLYYAFTVYTLNRGKSLKELDVTSMEKASSALDKVIASDPSYAESYIVKARINSALEKDAIMAENYTKYADLITAKGTEEVAKNKSKMVETYNGLAAHFANTDKTKAIEYFDKTLALDPTNQYALDSLKVLRKK